MKSLIILNPSSRHGKAIHAKEELKGALSRYGIDYKIHISKSAGDIKDAVKNGMADFDTFIGCGGDGTLHIIANYLAGTEKNLGSIPFGSGNDIATNLNIPVDIEKSCKIISDGKVDKIDMGLINKKFYYMAVSGAGFDSVVNDLANNTKFPIRGPAKYSYAVYKTLLTYRAKKFFIKIDEPQSGIKEFDVQAMFCVAANMPMYGGGMKIAPLADCHDGIIDVCLIRKMGKIHFIKTFPSVFEGKHLTDPFVDYFRAKTVEIDSEYNFSVFADGEYACKLPVKYEVAPKILNFIVP